MNDRQKKLRPDFNVPIHLKKARYNERTRKSIMAAAKSNSDNFRKDVPVTLVEPPWKLGRKDK